MLSAIKKVFTKNGLIMIVTVIIVAVLAWMFLGLLPNMKTIGEEIDELEAKRDELYEKTKDEGDLLVALTKAKSDLADFEIKFPPSIDQEDTLRTVQSIERKSMLTLNTMSYEKLQDDMLNQPPPLQSTDESAERVDQTQPIPGRGMKIPIRTQFASQYAELKNFVTGINDVDHKIGLREIQMTTGRDKVINGSVILEFYGFKPEETIE